MDGRSGARSTPEPPSTPAEIQQWLRSPQAGGLSPNQWLALIERAMINALGGSGDLAAGERLAWAATVLQLQDRAVELDHLGAGEALVRRLSLSVELLDTLGPADHELTDPARIARAFLDGVPVPYDRAATIAGSGEHDADDYRISRQVRDLLPLLGQVARRLPGGALRDELDRWIALRPGLP